MITRKTDLLHLDLHNDDHVDSQSTLDIVPSQRQTSGGIQLGKQFVSRGGAGDRDAQVERHQKVSRQNSKYSHLKVKDEILNESSSKRKKISFAQ